MGVFDIEIVVNSLLKFYTNVLSLFILEMTLAVVMSYSNSIG